MRKLNERRRAKHVHPHDIYLHDFFDPRIGRKLAGLVHIVNVKPEDPQSYWFELYGAKAAFGGGADFSARPVREIPSPAIRDMALESYAFAKKAGVPVVSKISASDQAFVSNYSRLILPLSDNGRDVTHLLVAICRQTFQIH